MALIKCEECGKEFSDKAKACPNCACPIKKKKKAKKPLDKWFIILFILTLFLCLVSSYFILLLWQVMIALFLGILCISIYVLMLFKMKKSKLKIVLSIMLGIFLIVCIVVSINELFYINKQNNIKLEMSNAEQSDNRTPKQRFHDTLLSKGFTTSDNINYTLNLSNHGNEMYSFVDLEEQLYKDYSYYNGLYILTEYYYGKQIVNFTYKYMGYYGNIEWNLKTTKWTYESSLKNWNAQKYVDDNMSDIILDFNELLNKANVSLEDIK